MMNPIDATFANLRASNRKAFMPFLTAGDPDSSFTQDAIRALVSAGANLVEIGFPFSDPIADGPVIQASYTRALNRKLQLAEIFRTLGELTVSAPLVAMASYSLIHKRGAAEFIRQSKAAGLSGVVLPDLPVEEAEVFAKIAMDADFKPIMLVTPTTSLARTERIVKACSGFVYVVSIVGITGERESLPTKLREMLIRLRGMTDLPLCVGFGVSKPEQVAELKSMADGIIVGTALVRKLEQANELEKRAQALQELQDLAGQFVAALNC